MILRYFYDDRLAQASYLVGCAKTGEALVVDPMRNILPYLKAAEKEGLRITHVTETHIHADFVSGSRELAAATGATIYLSDMGDANWKYAFADEPNVILVHDGDSWMVGNVRIEVIHTPGHTPEHISFMLTDTAGANRPMGVFTGDFLFVGDVGRPDLLEEAAGYKGTKEIGARQQFHSVRRFKNLPDYLQIWPGHGAGSACGKSLGAVPSTTLGYEKLFNPAFRFDAEDAFVAWLLDGQPEPPRYFAQMKKVNKEGPALLRTLEQPGHFERATLDAVIEDGGQVFDLRSRGEFAWAHVAGTVNIPATSNTYSTWIGWFVDYNRPLYLILPSLDALPAILSDLRAIGVDDIPGYFGPDVAAHKSQSLPLITAEELAQRMSRNGLTVLDVRGRSEYLEQHIRGARHIPLGYLPQRINELPQDKLIVTQCATGYRSQIAASILQAAGFKYATALNEGAEVWGQFLPTEPEIIPIQAAGEK
jgi:hydroxyacylglutathione hydrolase